MFPENVASEWWRNCQKSFTSKCHHVASAHLCERFDAHRLQRELFGCPAQPVNDMFFGPLTRICETKENKMKKKMFRKNEWKFKLNDIEMFARSHVRRKRKETRRMQCERTLNALAFIYVFFDVFFFRRFNSIVNCRAWPKKPEISLWLLFFQPFEYTANDLVLSSLFLSLVRQVSLDQPNFEWPLST